MVDVSYVIASMFYQVLTGINQWLSSFEICIDMAKHVSCILRIKSTFNIIQFTGIKHNIHNNIVIAN